ncbi:hypothetical protein ACA910_022054 [Epithemia clementina (nom. ined.)]
MDMVRTRPRRNSTSSEAEKTQIEICLFGKSTSDRQCSVLVQGDNDPDSLESVIALPNGRRPNRQRQSDESSRKNRVADLLRHKSPVTRNRRTFRDRNYRNKWELGVHENEPALRIGRVLGQIKPGPKTVAIKKAETNIDCDPCIGEEYFNRKVTQSSSYSEPVKRIVHTWRAAPPNKRQAVSNRNENANALKPRMNSSNRRGIPKILPDPRSGGAKQ